MCFSSGSRRLPASAVILKTRDPLMRADRARVHCRFFLSAIQRREHASQVVMEIGAIRLYI